MIEETFGWMKLSGIILKKAEIENDFVGVYSKVFEKIFELDFEEESILILGDVGG